MRKIFSFLKGLGKIILAILLCVVLSFLLPVLLVIFGLSVTFEAIFGSLNKVILAFFHGLRDGLQRYVK